MRARDGLHDVHTCTPPRPTRRRHQRRWKALAALIVVVVATIAIGGNTLGMTFAGLAPGSLPQPRQFAADSLVYDRTGLLIADLHPSGQSRIPVALDQISPWVPKAIVSVEDASFWTSGAVDPIRILSSAVHDLAHSSSLQGASTIPMQLAKIWYLTDNRSISYKLSEIALGSKLIATLPRTTILDSYLNDIFYGEGATGIQSASLVYFGVPASKLDLAQSALIAGLPNSPTALDPYAYPAAAKARQMVVLQAMVKSGDITQAQEQAAAAEPLHYQVSPTLNMDLAPAFVARVAAQVSSTLGLDPETAGLTIHSTLLYGMQVTEQRMVNQKVAEHRYQNLTDAAAISLLPTNGQVVAYVSGATGAPGSNYDMVSVPRSPGSEFKLFTYPTAFAERRATMLTPVLDGPFVLPTGGGPNGQGPWAPLDYSQTWQGVVPLDVAFGNSLNIPAIKTELLAGVPNVVETARRLGVTTLNQPLDTYTPSLTLGTFPVPLWEMAQAASAYADQGLLHPTTFVISVENGSGRNIWPAPSPGKQVIDPGVAYIVNTILENNNNRVLEFGQDMVVPGHLTSVKTGTSANYIDNTAVGWTPSFLTGVWVGNTNASPMVDVNGITGAGSLWVEIMKYGLGNTPDHWWPKPSDVVMETYGGQVGAFLLGTSPATGEAPLTSSTLAELEAEPVNPVSNVLYNPTGGPGTQATGTTNVRYSGNCRYWTYNGGNYYWCGSGMSSYPGDAGPAPS